MNERDTLKKCLEQVAAKFGWGDVNSWTNSAFTQLSKEIAEQTAINLSVSSLRRLFGISSDYKKEYNPQQETKNALANYLGYPGWSEYRRKINAPTNKQLKSKYLYIFLGIIPVLILVFLAVNNIPFTALFNRETEKEGTFFFEGMNLTSESIPNTVIIHYNISQLQKPVYIDWGDFPEDGGAHPSPIEIEQDSGILTHTYITKDIFNIVLLNANYQPLKRIRSFINTQGWECFSLQENNYFRLDSADFYSARNELLADPSILYASGIDSTQPYRVFYRNNGNFNIRGNIFNYALEFKPMFRKNYVECAHFQVEIFGLKGAFLITFMNKGCSGAIRNQFLAHITLDGATNDLSGFTVENQIWNKFFLGVTDSIIHINLNNKEILRTPYKGDIGTIIGTRLEFKGNGSIRGMDFPEI